jgi:hypothetical protein
MSEAQLARDCNQTLSLLQQWKAIDAIWFHIPNENPMSWANKWAAIKSAAEARRQGVLPGAPDLVIIGRSTRGFGPPITVLVELKSEKGKLSDKQAIVSGRCAQIEVPYAVVRSVQALVEFLRDNKLLNTSDPKAKNLVEQLQ